MNAKDRKAVASIISKLEGMKAEMEELSSTLNDIADAAQEAYDSMTEKAQESDRGTALAESTHCLADAASACDSGNVDEALGALGNLES
jgi:methyl-accepting chemotaxis protein